MKKCILGIETSCDDTGIGIIDAYDDGRIVILANVINTQDHQSTGGVVPEVAARRHAEHIIPSIEEALHEAGRTLQDIDACAVTYGPGLAPALRVGVETARTFGLTLNIPVYAVHHMRAHIASTFATHPDISFPAVVLLASGGHTLLVHMTDKESYRIMGTTRDDAAGEAFDKIAKMLRLPYPGGPAIARVAEQGNPHAYRFPRPMLHDGTFDFSFAGLKTAVLYALQKESTLSSTVIASVAASAQEAIVDVLTQKALRASLAVSARTLIVGGGVSANEALRSRLQSMCVAQGIECVTPPPRLFTDNGVMIAICASSRALREERSDVDSMQIAPIVPIS